MLISQECSAQEQHRNCLNSAFLDYYRCPEVFAEFSASGELSDDKGFFRFGRDLICYGRSSYGFRARNSTDELYDVMADVSTDRSTLQLPFDPSDVVANLRYERYSSFADGGDKPITTSSAVENVYYMLRPFLSMSVRKHLQRLRLRDWQKITFPEWPVDRTVDSIFESLLLLLLRNHAISEIPFIWFWPNGSPSCVIMTHDVEALRGRNFCTQLMDLDDKYEIKSSFQIVPEERYSVSEAFLTEVRRRGFEVNVHDLNHDGHLFSDRTRFFRRVAKINEYGRQYGASGFRSAVLYRNLNWYSALNFSYDMSVPSVGHLEAQRGGCCSVMPFFIGDILELPVTTTQDYSLFHILNQYSIDLWKQQIDLITKRNGLVSFIAHPDYIVEKRARDTYTALLAHLSELRSHTRLWIARPGEVNRWWRERSQMSLVRRGNRWEIEGTGKERARVAYATLEEGRVAYRLDAAS
jgi:hypothetical protein